MESKRIINDMPAYNLFINGKWVKPGKDQEVISPITQKICGYVPAANSDECKQAVDAAVNAKKTMAGLEAVERAELLEKLGEAMMNKTDELAEIIMHESGKPITLAEHEVIRTAQTLDYAAEEAKRIEGELLKSDAYPDMPEKLCLVVRQPLGVVLAIAPFNYPLNLAVAKIAPAIASGNTVVCKPASDDPMSVFEFGKLCEEIGMPAGSINIVSGVGSEVGECLVNSPDVDMVSFTGSTEIGKHIADKARFKKLHLEMGGKSPSVVLRDADIDLAVKQSVKGAIKFSGQRCDAVSRIIVEEEIADAFAEKAVEEVKSWKVGEPEEKDTQLGPLINERAVNHVEALVEDAKEKGADLLLGGKRLAGWYYAPTVLDNVNEDMRIAHEEIFGPVVVIMRVPDYETAIALANDSKYALHASIFTQDVNKAIDGGLRIEAGGVQVNGAPSRGPDNFPFGGDKESGIGREGIKYTIDEMTKVHSVVLNIQR